MDLRRRQQGQPRAVITHAWKTQQRLHYRFNHLSYRKRPQIAEVVRPAERPLVDDEAQELEALLTRRRRSDGTPRVCDRGQGKRPTDEIPGGRQSTVRGTARALTAPRRGQSDPPPPSCHACPRVVRNAQPGAYSFSWAS